MGNKMKRLTAVLLLVATLASFVVPATFADGSAETTYEYQITLYNAESDQGYNSWIGSNQKISEIKTNLDEAYAAGTLNWTYVDSADAANLTYRTNNGRTLRAKNGKNYTALKIRVPQAGRYALTYSVDTAVATNTATIAAYAIPAAQWSADAVDSLLANANYSLGEVAMAATDATITFAEKDYAAGEYVIVYKATTNTPIFLTELALTGTVAEETEPTDGTTAPAGEPVNLDFELYKNSDFSADITGAGNKLGNSKVANAINNAYAAGTHNWKLEAVADGVDTTVHTKFFSSADEGLRLTIGADKWIAFRIKVPQAGNYEVAVCGSNASNYPYQATVYAIAAPAGTMTATDVENAMTNANLVGVANITDGSSQDAAGEHTFAEGENILVIKVDSDRAAFVDIDLTPKAASGDSTEPTDGTTAPAVDPVKFDFEVYNHLDVFSGAANASGYKYNKIEETAKTAYTNGTYNWRLEVLADGLATDTNLKFFANNNEGLRFIDCNSKWVAFRVKVPEADSYEVSITNNLTDKGYKATVYAIAAPAEDMTAADVEAAMVSANRVGVADHTTGNTVAVAGVHTFAEGDNILIIALDSARAAIASIDLTPKAESEPTEPSTEETTAPPTVLQENVFDLELYNNTNLNVDGNYTKYNKVKSAINNAYPNTLNWKFEGFSAGVSEGDIRFIGKVTTNMGVKISGSAADGYFVAFRLNVTKAGKFDVVAKSLATTNYYTAKTWLVPVTSETLTEDALKAAMVDANALYDINFAKDQMTSNLGEYDFAVGEYVLIVAPSADSVYLSTILLANPGEYEKPYVDTRPEYVAQPGYFEMELYNYKGTGVPETGYTKYSKVQNTIEKGYPDKFNWKLEGFSKNLDVDSIQFVENGASSAGLRMKEDGTAGEWIALRLNSTESGKKELTIRSNYGNYTGKVWLFPAAAEAMTADQIAALMTDANFVGNVKLGGDAKICILTEREFAAGEYIIVVQADADKLYLDSISIADKVVEPPKDPVDKVVYDMDLVSMDPNFLDKGFTNWYSKTAEGKGIISVSAKISEMYADGSLNWKYETMSATASRFNCRKNHTQVKVDTNFSEVENAWNAIRISAPGAGTYDVRLYSDELSSVIADIYLIPARTGIAMTNEQIEAAMTSENRLVANALIDGRDTFYLGEYTFGAEYEYVMVFKFSRGKKVYINNIQMTKDGLVADTEVKKLPTYSGIVYDFDIGDKYTGILQPLGEYRYDMPTPKEAGYATPYEQMKSFWNSGKINWKWVAASDDLIEYDDNMDAYPGEYIRFYQDTGMYVYSKPDSWVAFKIKSPGSGDFTLTMNHAVAANDGTVAVYILPADTPTDEIWETTDPSNRVGKVVLTNKDGSAGKEDGFESFVGYWNFEAGKEYILVLEAYAASQFNATLSNMNISNIVMQKGIIEYETEETKTVKPVTVYERVFKTADSGDGNIAIFEMDGMDYYLIWLEGGTLLLYNLTTGELADEQFISTSRPRHMIVAPDGKIWMTGSGKFLVCYDPVSKTYEKTKTFMPKEYKHNGPAYMTVDENGIIYFNLNMRGNVIKYDPATKQFTDLGVFTAPDDFAGAMIYRDGYLYATFRQSGVHNKAVKYNIATGKIEGECEFMDLAGDNLAYGIGIMGEDILAVGVNTTYNDCAVTIDMNTMELVDLGLPGYISRCVTEEIEGKQYMIIGSYGLYEYDVATKEINKVPGFSSMSGTGFRGGGGLSYGKSWAIINGDFCLVTNESQVLCSPRVINMDKKEYYVWTDLTRDASGGGSRIISFTNAEPGSGEIVMGFWNAEFVGTYNTNTGEVSFTDSAGQTDSIGYYKGILYGGCYSATVLVELHRDTKEIIQRFKLDHETTRQKRLLAMETGGDHVFVGSVPDNHYVGGALTVYNTITGQWYSERNLVPDQSIVDMAYSNELVFVASSREGGDNTTPSGDSAIIFAYDYQNRELLATLDPRDYIPGLPSPVHYIYGLTADPNTEENGRIWAIVSDVLFCFTFDKETRTFDVQIVKDFGHTNYNTSSGVARQQSKINFIMENDQIYAMFKDAGMYCLTLADWNAPIGQVKVASAENIMGFKPEDYIIAEDGNLYFGNDADLMMLPLNVADEDWAIAGEVDAMITALGEITLESEAAIRSARSVYENTNWKYRALVQNLELLQEAESDILECKIDAALPEGVEITADSYPALLELMQEYGGLNTRQQRYVKNYKNLKAAYETASALNDQRIAAAMQERINGLKDLFPIETLEKEPQVVAVRTDFDALTGSQRILIDTTILEEAEAQIAVLRAELVKQVEALIQAIPDEITLEAEPAIVAAREGVDKLYVLELKEVSYSKLESAEAKLRNLKNALAKAEEFDALMKEIGIVTLGDKDRIANARKVYNSLNETAKAFCKKASKLNRAEFILKGLQTWMIPVIVVVDAAAIFAVLWFVPSLHSKVFKAKKKEEEPEVIDN